MGSKLPGRARDREAAARAAMNRPVVAIGAIGAIVAAVAPEPLCFFGLVVWIAALVVLV